MPTSMRAKPRATTIEDLYRVPEHGKAEIVDGKVILMSPTGGEPGYAGDEIFASLREYARRTQIGRAISDNKGFRVSLPQRKSFRPTDPIHPTRYGRGAIAEAEPAVPGWTMPVDDLFLGDGSQGAA